VQQGNVFTEAVRTRLLELLYSQPAEVDKQVEYAMKQRESQLMQIKAQLVDFTPAEVEAYLGTFKSPILGEITVCLVQGKLRLDAGEFTTELRKAVNQDGEARFVMVDPPAAGEALHFKMDDAGQPVIVIDLVTDVYTFIKT
jgi:hypothetical protein